MAASGDPAGTQPVETEWLDNEQLQAWKALIVLTQLLPGSLDRQLMSDAGLAHSDYAVLATLSAAPNRRLRMSDLAAMMDYSLSRLSHAMTRIEKAAWVKRESCNEDKRVYYAVLTERGASVLAEAAPGHVAHVKNLVFDHLSDTQVRQLGEIAEAILANLARRNGCATER
ncbi:MAG: MarR family transcriptional regulator [Acidimicrobiales bacterium]